MPFVIVGRTGPGMRQTVGFGDRFTGRGTFGAKFGAYHCNQWGLYGVCVRQPRDAALFPNYFGQTCLQLNKMDEFSPSLFWAWGEGKVSDGLILYENEGYGP